MPFFTGAIGYVTNWSGVWMLFYPVRFRGVRLPGLAPIANILPRRVQQIPGVMHGLLWQEPDLCDGHIEEFIAAHR